MVFDPGAARRVNQMADTYSPTANLAGGFETAITAVRTGYEAAKVKRPGLTAAEYARELGSSYLSGSAR